LLELNLKTLLELNLKVKVKSR